MEHFPEVVVRLPTNSLGDCESILRTRKINEASVSMMSQLLYSTVITMFQPVKSTFIPVQYKSVSDNMTFFTFQHFPDSGNISASILMGTTSRKLYSLLIVRNHNKETALTSASTIESRQKLRSILKSKADLSYLFAFDAQLGQGQALKTELKGAGRDLLRFTIETAIAQKLMDSQGHLMLTAVSDDRLCEGKPPGRRLMVMELFEKYPDDLREILERGTGIDTASLWERLCRCRNDRLILYYNKLGFGQIDNWGGSHISMIGKNVDLIKGIKKASVKRGSSVHLK